MCKLLVAENYTYVINSSKKKPQLFFKYLNKMEKKSVYKLTFIPV